MRNTCVLDPITPIPGYDTIFGGAAAWGKHGDGYDLPLDEHPAEPTTEPIVGEGSNFITLLSVTVDSPVITEGRWKDGMTITVGRADPRDSRGYFMTIKNGEKHWNSEVGQDDGFAVMTGLHEIGEMMSAMAQERLAHKLMEQLMHGMGEMPLSEFLARFHRKKSE